MGGIVPKGENNDEFIDNLKEAKYITKPNVEKVFRTVDRGDFFPGEYLEDAYSDQAMRNGNLHMSAPCIYCRVLENFDLKQGLSFLNVGFGTGYLSTLIGHFLGKTGNNYGIDIHQDVLEYAQQKIEEFILFNEDFDFKNFCEPKLQLANIECFDFSFRKFDRVYCGARVIDEELRTKLKGMIDQENGILIYPYGENLTMYKRTSATSFEETSLLNVQFAELLPKQDDDTINIRIYCQPKTLQSLCRDQILQFVPKDQLETLNNLPIPKTLIQYLKYNRDPNIQRPVREIKKKKEADITLEIHMEIRGV